MVLSANSNFVSLVSTDFRHYPVASAATIYKGGFVGINTSGYARALTAGDIFVGIAEDKVDNSAGSNGTKNVRVNILPFEGTLSSVAITDVGRPVYASADDTLTFSASGNSYVGFVSGYVNSTTAVITPEPAVLTPVGNNAVKTLEATGNQTLTAADRNKVILSASTTAHTLTFPLAATVGAGAFFDIYKTAGAGQAITLTPAGSDTIGGAANNATIDAAGDQMRLVSDGVSDWMIADGVA